MLRNEKNLLLEQQLEENLKHILDRESLEDVLDTNFACVWWILVHWPVEADSLLNLQMHHIVSKIRKWNLIHDIEDETF